jgi:hypothetical protein
MSTEQRRNPRVVGYAKAVHVATKAPGYIRDLSRTGCQVAFMQPVPVEIGDRIDIEVIAEHDPSLPPFVVCLRARWKKADGIWFSIGGEVESLACAENEGHFSALVSYYEGEP